MQEQKEFSATASTARFELDKPEHKLNQISEKIRESAFKIHRHFGPGLLEKTYKECLFYDLVENQRLYVEKEKNLPIQFEKLVIANAYRIDLLIENSIVVEIKSSEGTLPVHQAQILSYMKLGEYRLGYLINFNQKLIKDGIRRFAL